MLKALLFANIFLKILTPTSLLAFVVPRIIKNSLGVFERGEKLLNNGTTICI